MNSIDKNSSQQDKSNSTKAKRYLIVFLQVDGKFILEVNIG